jgi:endonuclease YncB( thermonuclease family)
VRTLRIVLSVALAVVAVAALPVTDAGAQTSSQAVVTGTLDAQMVTVRFSDGREATVRLIGIDGPSRSSECDFARATGALRGLVEGQAVNLVTDLHQPQLDAAGHELYYVDRAGDGVDAGEQMVAMGFATVDPDEVFDRQALYRSAQRDARDAGEGVWTDCDGNFHRTHGDLVRERQAAAAQFMRDYYRAISRKHFARAWDMLGRPVRRKLGSFAAWKAGYRRSLGVSVTSTNVRLSGPGAVVALTLRSRDRDACGGRVVAQRFRGRWVLAPRDDSWVAVNVNIHKTGGGRVRLSKADCPPPPPPPPPRSGPPSGSCTSGYSPCISPGSDVDCAGGSGNGPRYVDGPVRVTGDDPYGLDSDGDGYGCES